MQRSYFDTITFNSIKGIAVILLFILHLFASSDLWLPEFRIPAFQIFEKYFCYPANMCVAIFAFVTGYGFWFSSEKNYSRSLRKAFKVMTVYWQVFFLFFAIASITGIYTDFSLTKIGLSLIGLDEHNVIGDIIAFHWYLAFYLAVLVLLPASHNLLFRHKNILRDFVYLVMVPILLFSFLGKLTGSFFCLKRFFVDLVLWFPCVGMGYITARYALFEKLDVCFATFCKNGVKWRRTGIDIVFIALTFYGMFQCPGIVYTTRFRWLLPVVINMSVVYILFFTYAFTDILKMVDNFYIRSALSVLGRYSLYMWLFNGIFFNIFKAYTQPVLIYPKNALLILIWGLFICFILTKMLLFLDNLISMRD